MQAAYILRDGASRLLRMRRVESALLLHPEAIHLTEGHRVRHFELMPFFEIGERRTGETARESLRDVRRNLNFEEFEILGVDERLDLGQREAVLHHIEWQVATPARAEEIADVRE